MEGLSSRSCQAGALCSKAVMTENEAGSPQQKPRGERLDIQHRKLTSMASWNLAVSDLGRHP